MSGRIITALSEALLRFENAITSYLSSAIFRNLQPGLCVSPAIESEHQSSKFSIRDIWKDGFLWGVPKHRRSIEKRLSRKFGFPKYNWKPLVPKTNLLTCRSCGHHYEADTICGHCYEKVKEETELIQQAMEKEFRLDPVKDDIVVFYEDEKHLKSAEFWKGQRIIEMPKKRPEWFHKNLLQPTTQKLSDSKESKPNDLA